MTSCPACEAPATVLGRFVLESTGGPVEHLKVECDAGHRFMGSVEALWPTR